MRRLAIAACSLALILPALLGEAAAEPRQAQEPAGSFELVGHNPLMNRGMNAALAVHGDYAYVGSRTDALHPNAGVMVLDISDPRAPEVVHQIPGRTGITTREMRIWPEEELLIVLDLATNCSPIIHNCLPVQNRTDMVCVNSGLTAPDPACDTFSFYDISGDKAAAPELVSQYVPSDGPHEFFLWDDPKKSGRALLLISGPGGPVQMLITDISNARDDEFTELAGWTTVIPDSGDNRLHSFGVSNDGKYAYLAFLQGGFLVVDISQATKGVPEPEFKLITSMADRPTWEGPGAHSAVKLFGRPYVLVSDEVYGEIPGLLPDHGCPWGWVRMIDIKDPVLPKVIAEYKTAANEEDFCNSSSDNPPDRNSLSSHSAHNPTLTRNLAFITWHSEGLHAIDLKDPTNPATAAVFMPEPLPFVVTEDPVLSSGLDKVVMWSYPVIKDGLIYVVDIRNGFYVLKYTGPYESEVAKIKFLEGNSNLGDALKLEKP